jgi:CDP-glycerol glycerophosphotransferase
VGLPGLQNRFSTEIFRRAFRFEGEVLEVGYPRNDVLSSPGRDAIRRAVRAELGIDDDVQVLLYAPTFRDDQKDASGRLAFAVAIDLARMQEALGGRYVVLLRLHHWVSAGLGPLPEQSAATSPTAETSTSSTWPRTCSSRTTARSCSTTRSPESRSCTSPMTSSYRDAGRGFYFDLEAEAPGPLCRTTDELVGVLQEPDRLAEDHAGAYRRFRDTYCYLDDGHAAERVVERLFA